MINLFAIGFVLGAWLLQQQPELPNVYVYSAILPMAFLAFRVAKFQPGLIKYPTQHAKYQKTKYQNTAAQNNATQNNSTQKIAIFSSANIRHLQRLSLFICAVLLGFYWAAGFASLRLNDELPKEWQQKNIELVGVVATLPETTERGERFEFDVEKVLTKDATQRLKVPAHISLNFYGDNKFNSQSTQSENNSQQIKRLNNNFHAGERWQFSVKLKRPHTTYNPHGFDFEAWALSENIRATGSINQKSDQKKLSNFVFRPSYIVEHFREIIGNHISNTLINQPYAGVIRALVIGDDSQIAQADWTVYLRTGTNHLMSISYLLKHKF